MKINAKNKFFSKEREDINQLGKLKPNEFWSRDSEDISLRWRNANRTFKFVRSLISQSGKDKYTKLYILRKPTISGIHYMKMKSSDLIKIMILIFVFILTYLFFHRSILFYQKRSHLIQGIMW